MASKRIDELTTRTVADTDLLPVTPSGGPSGSATVAAIVAEGLSQPNSASAGAGASITIKAADGVTSGAGGGITITPGEQATTGGPGKVVIDTLTVGRGASGVANNTAVGASALAANTSGSQNVCVGDSCGKVITTGSLNTGIGSGVLTALTSGSNNAVLGGMALDKTTTGGNNVAIGSQAARFTSNGVTLLATASNNIYIGASCRALSNSDSNSIVIGYQSIGEGSNIVVIGNSSTQEQHLWANKIIRTEASIAYAPYNTTAITTSQNNYTLGATAFNRLNCTTASDITGIGPSFGYFHVDGRMIRVVNVGTATLTLKHDSTSSTAANRMFMSGAADKALAVNAWADLVYDSTNNGSGAAGWRVM